MGRNSLQILWSHVFNHIYKKDPPKTYISLIKLKHCRLFVGHTVLTVFPNEGGNVIYSLIVGNELQLE